MASNKKKKTEDFKLNPFEKFEVIEINRPDVKNAPYNPRSISKTARAKLEKNLSKVGLLSPIVWNKRTGNIVAGHQRIAALDSISKTYEYKMRVSAVDLDEKTEKEQNIFMNNVDAQGDFNLEKVGEMLKDIDIENAGLDLGDIYKVFGEDVANKAASPDKLKELSLKLKDRREDFNKVKKTNQDRNDVHFYAVVVFKNHDQRKALTDVLKLEDNRYIDGRFLMDALTLKDGGKAPE
jgi:anaerobic glycerol-3-phosphate dehydrogenase